MTDVLLYRVFLNHNILLVFTLVGKEGMCSEGTKRNKGMHRTVIVQAKHYKQDPIYEFPEMKLSSFVLSFHIHVSVSDLYIPGLECVQNGTPMSSSEFRTGFDLS